MYLVSLLAQAHSATVSPCTSSHRPQLRLRVGDDVDKMLAEHGFDD
jgi:hypothetical protein